MTGRLYYRDATLLVFDGSVIAHAGDGQHVVLDHTAFYPTSGGQPHDTGRLNGVLVVDVIDEGEQIVHVLDRPLPLGPVHGEVDGPRRRDHAQQHTAQHLLSALAADRFGWQTTSVHFGAAHSTIEFATAVAGAGQLSELEQRANELVASARRVSVSFEDAGDAQRTGLRKPPERTGELRVITIDGVDRSACGGTHVEHTGELGAVVLLEHERLRGHVRVAFVAGDRVRGRLHASIDLLGELARRMGCSVDELVDLLPRRLQDLHDATARMAALEREVAAARVRALADAQSRDDAGLRRVVYRDSAASPSLLSAMTQAAASLPRLLFIATPTVPPIVYVGTSADSDIDAGSILKQALGAVGGRGGGSARMAQGTVPSPASLESVIAAISAWLR